MFKLVAALTLSAALCAGCAGNAPFFAPPFKESAACRATNNPQNGLYEIDKSLVWRKAKHSENGIPAYVASTTACDAAGKTYAILLVAGPIGDPQATDGDLRGVKPPDHHDPADYKAGVSVCHFLGKYDASKCTPEIVRLQSGFLYVSAERIETHSDRTRAINPWPFIIRTPAMPAGPRASSFVMLAYPDRFGGLLSEHLLRPGQPSEDCTPVDDVNDAGAEVLCRALGQFYTLTAPGSLSIPASEAQPAPLTESEVRFLKDVCEFVNKLKISDDTFNWPCGSETHEKR